ncbi:VUT family protein [Nocardioides sp. SYSU D00065]|uniref:VUT family protein n=1 Tax=Nocardioides sp. SYSU D00065 TaxID=2817378 RepID=UPI001B32B610|nr:VUT family protein [Nocardioides sp. SYSU D00065]
MSTHLEREALVEDEAKRSGLALGVSVAGYVTAVVLANIVTEQFGLVSVGFGLLVTAGTYAAGFALLARDFVHRFGGRGWAIAAITLGGAISWAFSSPALAVASTVAFVSAELVDLIVYEPIRRTKGFISGALVSNVVSAPIDTFVFLSLAGFPLTLETVGGQFVGKVLWATALPLAIYWLGRRWVLARRSSSHTYN